MVSSPFASSQVICENKSAVGGRFEAENARFCRARGRVGHLWFLRGVLRRFSFSHLRGFFRLCAVQQGQQVCELGNGLGGRADDAKAAEYDLPHQFLLQLLTFLAEQEGC